MYKNYKSMFMLDPKTTYLNHGSFGACPKTVFESLINWQKELERNPLQHLGFDIYKYLENSRTALSDYINCDKDDVVFSPNPSTALNTVIKSLKLTSDDEILTTNHEYGALDKSWDFICKKTGAQYRKQNISLPLLSKEKFLNQFFEGFNKKTKIIFISHITSATGLIFPIEEICDFAKEKNILCIIDGAHVPGHIDLNIKKLNPDIYVGACHKWMCAPKGVSFLYVKKELQSMIDPLVVSWGYEAENPSHSKFLDYHQWQGTNDMSAYLTIPDVIKFLNENNWIDVSIECKKNTIIARDMILEFLNTKPISNHKFLGQMSSMEINYKNPELLCRKLAEDYNIHIPAFNWNNKIMLRISMQAYNSLEDIDKLIFALKNIIKQ